MCKVKNVIYDSKFEYSQPWFYKNELALRCDLETGTENNLEYFESFKRKAMEIFQIVFHGKADCFFIDNYIYRDFYSDDFLQPYKEKFRYEIVSDIKVVVDSEWEEIPIKVERYIFYLDNASDIEQLLINNIDVSENPHIHFASFKNECIYSIYDERGCDIVFFEADKYCEMYGKLSKYLSKHDTKLMKDRFDKAKMMHLKSQ